jgi:hypothetical protein
VFQGCFVEGFKRAVEDILSARGETGGKQGQWPCVCVREASASRFAKWYTRNYRFQPKY